MLIWLRILVVFGNRKSMFSCVESIAFLQEKLWLSSYILIENKIAYFFILFYSYILYSEMHHFQAARKVSVILSAGTSRYSFISYWLFRLKSVSLHRLNKI